MIVILVSKNLIYLTWGLFC